MKKFNGYPKAYKRDTLTKLLYLYKIGLINREQWLRARFFNAMTKAKSKGKLSEALEIVAITNELDADYCINSLSVL